MQGDSNKKKKMGFNLETMIALIFVIIVALTPVFICKILDIEYGLLGIFFSGWLVNEFAKKSDKLFGGKFAVLQN